MVVKPQRNCGSARGNVFRTVVAAPKDSLTKTRNTEYNTESSYDASLFFWCNKLECLSLADNRRICLKCKNCRGLYCQRRHDTQKNDILHNNIMKDFIETFSINGLSRMLCWELYIFLYTSVSLYCIFIVIMLSVMLVIVIMLNVVAFWQGIKWFWDNVQTFELISMCLLLLLLSMGTK